MPLHAGARFHAFIHGLFRPSDYTQTRERYEKVACRFARLGLATEAGREHLIAALSERVLDSFDLPPDHPQREPIADLITALFEYEGLFCLPRVDWSERYSVSAYWEIRDTLDVQRHLADEFTASCNRIVWCITACLDPIYTACPALLASGDGAGDITVRSELVHSVAPLGAAIETIIAAVFDDALDEAKLFDRSRTRLEQNLVSASGGNPADTKAFTRSVKRPAESGIKDARTLAGTYLGGTPFAQFFRQDIDFAIPTRTRFEHQHIIAGSGHGKTQTLQYLIACDLKAVAKGTRSIVVLDSQGDMIRTIARLAEFAPGGALHERIVIIDPTDVEWPVSLNLFDVGMERLSGYAPLERERLTNSILELYDFVLGSLLSAEMTQKQSVIFRYVTRLMLHIPDATIHTLRELMEQGSHIKFAPHIEKLEGTARHFFETEFPSKEFEQTKKQVLRRLWGILENQTFERMFSHPRSKLDLFSEMNAGKVILINTAKDLLKEQGTEIFGRFFIAMIAQAAQERAALPENKRMPVMVYVDEAADYFDRNIGIILSQARKYAVGMVLAHQYLGQLEPRLQEAFAANTSIKFAGGVSAKDAKTLAPMLYCDSSFIEAQPKGHFAAYLRGITQSAVPLAFPFGYLEEKPQMSDDEYQALQTAMRERYAVHYTKLGREAINEPAGHKPDREPNDPAAPADIDNPDW